ncbi:MAG TPA: hypothetical protein VGQ83_12740 [Polyangia bacterium]
MARSKVDETLARAMDEHADDPERVELLSYARAFKSSWVELGEALARVKSDETFRRWGHESFEEYVRQELHVKPETALKMCGSFGFLQQHAPEVLERDGVSAPIPAYQAVDFLARAFETTSCPKETREEIRHAVLDEGLPAATVARKFKEAVFPVEDGAKKDGVKERARGQLLVIARRLAQLLAEVPDLPRALAEEIEEQIGRLVMELQRQPAGEGRRKAPF